MEAAISVSEGTASADKAALFKTMTKILCQKVDLMATFMAKWSPDWPGQSGHINVTLQDKKGKPVFYDVKKPNNMSDEMRYFVGGQ